MLEMVGLLRHAPRREWNTPSNLTGGEVRGDPSRLVAGERGDGGFDAVLLRDAGDLEIVGEADAGEVPAGEELGRRVELVEQLLGETADQVLAEVGDLGVLVDAEDAVGLADAGGDGVPVVGVERAEVDDL